MSRYFGHDPALGVMESFHYDNSADNFIIETVADVGPVIENNKRLQNEGDGYSPSREWRRIAAIPNVIAEKWKNELGVDVFNRDHFGKIRQLLNDPDYRFLRTSPGVF